MKLVGLALGLLVLALIPSCRDKPESKKPVQPQAGVAYVENPDQMQAREKPLEGVPRPDLQTFPQETGERKPASVPDFFDVANRQVKDLPSHPAASIINMQYGPVSGVETVLMFFNVAAKFDDVTTFYDKAIKQHGWTVQTNTRERDDYTWKLAKGVDDQALLQVKKTEESQIVQVGINRFRSTLPVEK